MAGFGLSLVNRIGPRHNMRSGFRQLPLALLSAADFLLAADPAKTVTDDSSNANSFTIIIQEMAYISRMARHFARRDH